MNQLDTTELQAMLAQAMQLQKRLMEQANLGAEVHRQEFQVQRSIGIQHPQHTSHHSRRARCVHAVIAVERPPPLDACRRRGSRRMRPHLSRPCRSNETR